MQLMVALETEDECFPASGCHQLLPERLAVGNIFQLPYVVDFKRALSGFTILAFLCVQALDKLGATERKRKCIGRCINLWVRRQWLFEVFQAEDSDDAGLLFPFYDECISIVSFETICGFLYAHLVLAG